MKNNKGISIVEIIISITLISLVMVFLFSLLITVRNEDDQNRAMANMLISQAMIIKEVETDFIEYDLIGISSCEDGEGKLSGTDSVRDIVPTNANLSDSTPEGNCLKLHFNPAKTKDNIGYLLYYQYGYTDAVRINVVGYKRGEKRVLREVPSASSNSGSVIKDCSSNVCVVAINLPVLDENGEDYGIHLSYTTSDVAAFIYNPMIDSKYNFNLN